MKKIFFLLFIFLNLKIFSDDQSLSRYYLVKANESLKNGDYGLANNLLEQSYGYYRFYPEYFYLKNQLIDSRRENLFKKNKNSEMVLKYIDNQFLINKYTMLKDSFIIFKKTLDYKNCSNSFQKILNLENIDILDDYIEYMEFLTFFEDYNNLDRVINLAKSRYESLDIEYYLLLLNANKKNISNENFNKKVEIFSANGYSLTKLLYAKSIFYNDSLNIKKIFTEYKNLKNSNAIENKYKKDILFNLIMKFSFFSKTESIELIREWLNSNGLNDIKSDSILKDSKIFNFIRSDKEFSNKFLLFDGIRTKDIDRDGNWEEFYEYKSGRPILIIKDINQDGLYELKIEYYNEKIKSYYEYFNESNENYKKYNFNINDNSVNSIEYYSNNKLIKRINLIKSIFRPDLTKFVGIKDSEILTYIDNIEYFNKEYIIERYKNGVVIVKLIDSNNNSFFDIREEYKNGIKEKVVKDLNENGFFEVVEIYLNGKVSTIFYSNYEDSGKYDYKEVIKDNSKYWDNNLDGIYEISVERKDNAILTKFDINFDGNYDIIYEELKNYTKVYKLEKGKSILINYYREPSEKEKKGWVIVSPRDLNIVEVPDKIDMKDKNKLNGFFYHKDKKYYFENGIIKNEYVNFKIFLLEDKIYLIDHSGVK